MRSGECDACSVAEIMLVYYTWDSRKYRANGRGVWLTKCRRSQQPCVSAGSAQAAGTSESAPDRLASPRRGRRGTTLADEWIPMVVSINRNLLLPLLRIIIHRIMTLSSESLWERSMMHNQFKCALIACCTMKCKQLYIYFSLVNVTAFADMYFCRNMYIITVFNNAWYNNVLDSTGCKAFWLIPRAIRAPTRKSIAN